MNSVIKLPLAKFTPPATAIKVNEREGWFTIDFANINDAMRKPDAPKTVQTPTEKPARIPPRWTGEDHPPFDCVHRGEKRRTGQCVTCSSRKPVSIFQCTIKGECSYEHRASEKTVAQCSMCLDKHEPTDATTIPASLAHAKPDEIASAPSAWKWAVGITTAPRAKPTLDVTAASVIESGFPAFHVFAEPDTAIGPIAATGTVHHRVTRFGAFGNYIAALRDLLDAHPDADALLLVQDDTILAGQGLAAWLEKSWPAEPMACLSLYTAEPYSLPHAGWGKRLDWIWGACAIAWKPDAARAFLESNEVALWEKQSGIDVLIGHYATAAGLPVYYPSPSLAQHVGHTSTVWPSSLAIGARRSTTFIGYNSAALARLDLTAKPLEVVAPVIRTPAPAGEVRIAPDEGVTLITCTGDRPRSFRLLERWMERQTYGGPIQWLVVDDGQVPTVMHRGQHHIRRKPSDGDALPSMNMNLLAALPHINRPNVLIIEDDDYYPDDYVRQMLEWLREHEIVGQSRGLHYHLEKKAWMQAREDDFASLCRTGMRTYLLEQLGCAAYVNDVAVDTRLWKNTGAKKLLVPEPTVAARCVSIKGVPGRRGYTWDKIRSWQSDRNGYKLREWIGEDAEHYERLHDPIGRVIVYTTLFPGEPAPSPQSLDTADKGTGYVVFTDREKVDYPWKPIKSESGADDQWRWRVLTHLMFAKADWTVYVEPGVRMPSSPHKMIASLIAKHGEQYGYELPGVLVRRNDAALAAVNHQWAATKERPQEVVRVA